MGTFHYGPTVVETAADTPDELALLATVIANPLDELPKLIYADWLEERGDARGEFLRDFVRLTRNPGSRLPFGEEFPLPWRDVVGIHARALIRRHILDGDITGSMVDRLESTLLATSRPTVYLVPTPADDAEMPSGCTKLGGRPDLPPVAEWPVALNRWRGFREVHIFCAQIRLDDLAMTLAGRELPSTGLVSLFHRYGSGPVLFNPSDSPLRRVGPPERDQDSTMTEYSFTELPPYSVRMVEGLDLRIRFEDTDWWSTEFHSENWDFLNDIHYDLNAPGSGVGVCTKQLLGNGLEYNGDESKDAGKRRLAVLGTDPDSPYHWGDSNQPIWYIAESDLAAGRLDLTSCRIG